MSGCASDTVVVLGAVQSVNNTQNINQGLVTPPLPATGNVLIRTISAGAGVNFVGSDANTVVINSTAAGLATLQSAYDNSISPANIQLSNANQGININDPTNTINRLLNITNNANGSILSVDSNGTNINDSLSTGANTFTIGNGVPGQVNNNVNNGVLISPINPINLVPTSVYTPGSTIINTPVITYTNGSNLPGTVNTSPNESTLLTNAIGLPPGVNTFYTLTLANTFIYYHITALGRDTLSANYVGFVAAGVASTSLGTSTVPYIQYNGTIPGITFNVNVIGNDVQFQVQTPALSVYNFIFIIKFISATI